MSSSILLWTEGHQILDDFWPIAILFGLVAFKQNQHMCWAHFPVWLQHIHMFIHKIKASVWWNIHDMIWYDLIWYEMIWYNESQLLDGWVVPSFPSNAPLPNSPNLWFFDVSLWLALVLMTMPLWNDGPWDGPRSRLRMISRDYP